MAYDRARGAHQAKVLYRLLHMDGRFPLADVARRADLNGDQLNDWCANRQPVPQWATSRLLVALEELDPGAGVAYLVEALQLEEVAVVMPLPKRWGGSPTEQAQKVLAASDQFAKQVVAALVGERSPGLIDDGEVAELEPARRELVAALAAYGAAAVRADREQRRMAFDGGEPTR
jgi:hypothetical protein